MSDTLIPAKVDRLVKHLREGGNEADAPRVLKILEQEAVSLYLAAAKEKLGDDASKQKAPAKAEPKTSSQPVEEEDLADEFDDDDWDAQDPVEEVVEEAAPVAAPTEKNVLLDENNIQKPLVMVSSRNGKTVWKIYEDEIVQVMIGRKSVGVPRDAVLGAKDPRFTLSDGSVYPTEFLQAAVNLAIM